MTVKVLLTLSLFAGWLYIFTQSGISRILRFSLYTILCFGLYTVWFPETSTYVANALGIGRGADLIFYTWIAFSFGVLLNVHLKLRQQLNLITRLARTIAIENSIVNESGVNSKNAVRGLECDIPKTINADMQIFIPATKGVAE